MKATAEYYEIPMLDTLQTPTPKFELGTILITRKLAAKFSEHGYLPYPILNRHQSGDWGPVPVAEYELNDAAVRDGQRIISAYEILGGIKVYVTTESDRLITIISMKQPERTPPE